MFICEQGWFERSKEHHSPIVCALALGGPIVNKPFTFIAVKCCFWIISGLWGCFIPAELPAGLPPIRGIEHQIDLVHGASLPNHPAYRTNLEETKEIQW
jgi:hypothetical protein